MDKHGPLYSLPKVSCSACSAGDIDWKSDSESSESRDSSDMSSSDSSLRSVSDSESNEAGATSVLLFCEATATGAGAIAWFPLAGEAGVLFALFALLSSMWARSAGWYSIAFAEDVMSIRGIYEKERQCEPFANCILSGSKEILVDPTYLGFSTFWTFMLS